MLKLKNSTRQTLRFLRYRKRFQLAKKYCRVNHIPDISKEERKEIKQYWKRFGIKIRDFKWYAMYYSVTGIHNPRFVPEDIAVLVVYPYYNDVTYRMAWKDKNYFERLLPGVPMPETVCKCIRGRLLYEGGYHSSGESDEILAAFLLDYYKRAPLKIHIKHRKISRKMV